jgi:hypothetical protein
MLTLHTCTFHVFFLLKKFIFGLIYVFVIMCILLVVGFACAL